MIREEIKDIAVSSELGYRFFPEEWYGYDQVYDSFPCVFPTVLIELEERNGLNFLADKAREKEGFIPLFDDSGEYDEQGWYVFDVKLNGYSDTHLDNCIYVEVEALHEHDDMESFVIELSSEEQSYIYKELNKQIDCEELLRQAAEEMKDVAGGELTILPMKEV